MDIDKYLNSLRSNLESQCESFKQINNFCPYCGQEIAIASGFCPYCGEEIRPSKSAAQAPKVENFSILKNDISDIIQYSGNDVLQNYVSNNRDNVVKNGDNSFAAEISSAMEFKKDSGLFRFSNSRFDKSDDFEYPSLGGLEEDVNDDSLHSIILTNVYKLVEKYFGCASNDLIQWVYGNVFNPYIEQLNHMGFECRFLDIGAGVVSGGIQDSTSWYEIMQVLDELHDSKSGNKDIPHLLFIVGGDDVIPMPCISNSLFVNYSEEYYTDGNIVSVMEKDIHSDFPYCVSSSCISMNDDGTLDWNQLLSREFNYAVSRLPLEGGRMATDITEDIVSYLNRSLKSLREGGMRINKTCYAACQTAKDTMHYLAQFMPPTSVNITDEFAENGIFICPETDKNTSVYCEKLRDADMLFYLMHGGNAPDTYFVGENMQHECPIVLSPDMLKDCSAQMLVAMCCWGARFVNYTRERSMLLSGIYSNLLTFLGSSRNSFGNFCPKGSPKPGASGGQLILLGYINYMMQGLPSALALLKAKIDYMDRCHNIEQADMARLVLLEFNVFGSPFEYVNIDRSIDYRQQFKVTAPQVFSTVRKGVVATDIFSKYGKTEQKPKSIFKRLRSMVDENFSNIHQRITNNLYDQYGLEPRNLELMRRIEHEGNVFYMLAYQNPSNSIDGTLVYTDASGNIKDIYTKF